MRVSDIQIVDTADWCELRAHVASDCDQSADEWFEPFSLWYRFPAWCRPLLSAENGDPFLAALLPPAMRVNEPLALPAAVSPRLLETVPEIEAIYHGFDRRNARIWVEGNPRVLPLPTGGQEPGVGLFFSMGVDSFYSLLKNLRDHPADSKAITHLIYIHGLDVAYKGQDERLPSAILANLQRIATETGKTLILVETNVRRVAGWLAPWTMAHGGGTVSVALALGSLLRRVHIAASTTYDWIYPWGTHPVLDPLWSTESMRVIHDGCEMDSIDKTRMIARSGLALETLRVCPGYTPDYNCGRCPKCMRTMLDLLQAGALDRCRTLPHEIDPDRLREALRQGGGPVHVQNFRRRLETLESAGGPPALRSVLAEHLALEQGGRILPQPAMVTRAHTKRRRPRDLLRRWLRR